MKTIIFLILSIEMLLFSSCEKEEIKPDVKITLLQFLGTKNQYYLYAVKEAKGRTVLYSESLFKNSKDTMDTVVYIPFNKYPFPR